MRVALIGVPLLLLFLSLASGFVLVWRLFFLSLLVLLFSFIWMLRAKHGIEVQSTKLPDHCQAGQWIEQRITAVNNGKVPLLLATISQKTNLPGYHESLQVTLSAHKTMQTQVRIYCQQRGRYKVGALVATVTDLFGLFYAKIDFGEQQNIIVYPTTLDLLQFSPFAHDDYMTRAKRWMGSGISSMASRVREYVSGDNLNHIHWRSTAHSGQLMVKVFDSDPSTITSGTIWIVLDMQKEVHTGIDNNSTEEYCVTIAASLIKKYVEQGIPVGLIMIADKSYIIPPALGEQQLWYLMELLAVINAAGKVPVEHVVLDAATNFGSDTSVIIITPSCSLQIPPSLKSIRNRGSAVLAILIEPVSFGGSGNITLLTSQLLSNGVQVYIVKHGENLEAVLSSQGIISPADILKV